MAQAQHEHFKHCTMCGTSWRDLAEFVTDFQLRVEGYQACFPQPDLGLVMLTHRADGCGTTLAVAAAELRPLYDGPEFTEHRVGQEDCEKHCLQVKDIEECDVECDMAWIRTVMQYLRRHELPAHMK